jgi:hypothetical protein
MPTSSSRSNTPGKRDRETAAPETLRLGDGANGPLAVVDGGLPLSAVVLPTGKDELGTVKIDWEATSSEALRPGDKSGKVSRETTSPETLRPGDKAAALGLGGQAEKRGRGKVARRKKKKSVDEKPLEDVTMTKEQKMELWSWLRKEMTDPNFMQVDPVKLNHAFLTFIAQVVVVLKLKPAQVEGYTGMKPPHLHKLRPHVNHLDDVHVALTSAAKWLSGLHLNPAHVLERLMKQMMAVLMPFSDLAA